MNRRPQYYIEAETLRANSAQWDAYNSCGHTVVLAGPGSGKTKVLVTKVARMLHEDVHAPRGIACVTFSNECARELERRFTALGLANQENLFIGTVHTFCLKHIIIPYARLAGLAIPTPIAVAKSSDRRAALGEALSSIGRQQNPENFLDDFKPMRRLYLGPERENNRLSEEDIRIIEAYEEALRRRGLIDFDDMIILGLQLIDRHKWVRDLLFSRFPILVIDEYQDLGVALHLIVERLCFEAGMRLFAVGDWDQSIYGFMGAQPDLLEQLSNRPDVKRIQLSLNYRCSTKIVEASQVALAEPRNYRTPENAEEGVIHFYQLGSNAIEQARGICAQIIPEVLQYRPSRKLGDIAILYPNVDYGDAMAQAATAAGYAYTRLDPRSIYRKTRLTRWIEQCAIWCSGGWKVAQPRLNDLMYKWMGWNTRINSHTQQVTLQQHLSTFLWNHRDPEERLTDWLNDLISRCLRPMFKRQPELTEDRDALVQLFNACKPENPFVNFTVGQFASQHGTPDHLNLITLHSAKGCEFDSVIMMGIDKGVLPNWRIRSVEEKQEARRLFYVGITRAKHDIHLICCDWGTNQHGYQTGPSELIIELFEKLEK